MAQTGRVAPGQLLLLPRLLVAVVAVTLCSANSATSQTTAAAQVPKTTKPPSVPLARQTTAPGPIAVVANEQARQALAADLDSSLKGTTVAPTTELPNRIAHDANKELIDYGDDLLQTLDFVQTLKLADGQSQVSAMLAKHHNQDELHEYLKELTRLYPEVTRLYSIGKSVEGRDLWAIELSEQPGKHQSLKPQFRYVANMHGNEVVGRELTLHLARLLAENYRAARDEPESEAARPSGPKFVKKLLRDTRIHILPSLNPDGHANSMVSCSFEQPSRKGRLNANNVDLNRNFPDKSVAQLDRVSASTQPETRAFIEWSLKEPFVLSANLHGGALVASIPYDNAPQAAPAATNRSLGRVSPDDDVFRQVAAVYSNSHKFMHTGEDCYDRCMAKALTEHKFLMGITVGSQWYSLQGGLQDWVYENTNYEFDITLELGCNQYPPASAMPHYWELNKLSLVNFIRETHRGIKGLVTDEAGRPLPNVSVRVSDREHLIRTDAFGEYYRLLLPGIYELTFERADLKAQKSTINLSHNGMAQILNIKMAKSSDASLTESDVNQPAGTTGGFPSSGGAHSEGEQHPSAVGALANEDHSLVVATLTMSVITVVILIMMAGAYVIQKRRFTRSQSVSVELQPRSASTGVNLSGKTSSTSLGTMGGGGGGGGGGSSTNLQPHLPA